jgi:hypothetical protein
MASKKKLRLKIKKLRKQLSQERDDYEFLYTEFTSQQNDIWGIIKLVANLESLPRVKVNSIIRESRKEKPAIETLGDNVHKD